MREHTPNQTINLLRITKPRHRYAQSLQEESIDKENTEDLTTSTQPTTLTLSPKINTKKRRHENSQLLSEFIQLQEKNDARLSLEMKEKYKQKLETQLNVYQKNIESELHTLKSLLPSSTILNTAENKQTLDLIAQHVLLVENTQLILQPTSDLKKMVDNFMLDITTLSELIKDQTSQQILDSKDSLEKIQSSINHIMNLIRYIDRLNAELTKPQLKPTYIAINPKIKKPLDVDKQLSSMSTTNDEELSTPSYPGTLALTTEPLPIILNLQKQQKIMRGKRRYS